MKEMINSNTIVECQHCGKLTNYADNRHYQWLAGQDKSLRDLVAKHIPNPSNNPVEDIKRIFDTRDKSESDRQKGRVCIDQEKTFQLTNAIAEMRGFLCSLPQTELTKKLINLAQEAISVTEVTKDR